MLTPCGLTRAGDVAGKQATGRLDAAGLSRLIDQAIQQRLSAENATPAPPADDAEFPIFSSRALQQKAGRAIIELPKPCKRNFAHGYVP